MYDDGTTTEEGGGAFDGGGVKIEVAGEVMY